MRIFITGMTGFVGSHLAELLQTEGGHSLVGVNRSGQWPESLSHLATHAELLHGELGDKLRLIEVLEQVRPDWVIHLAGYANTGGSFKEPAQCWADNLHATQNLYDVILQLAHKPRALYASTGLIYGDPDQPGEASSESTVLKPASPYAASKAAADLLSYQYFRTHNLQVMRVRLFNQFGPRQTPDYALPSFARQIARAEAGQQEPIIRTGDLSSFRDLTDVRDMVRALRLIIEHGQPGEAYNAGSGHAVQIREVLAQLVSHSTAPLRVEERIDPSRKADTSVSKADLTKLQAATGWKPQFALSDSLHQLLQFWCTTITSTGS